MPITCACTGRWPRHAQKSRPQYEGNAEDFRKEICGGCCVNREGNVQNAGRAAHSVAGFDVEAGREKYSRFQKHWQEGEDTPLPFAFEFPYKDYVVHQKFPAIDPEVQVPYTRKSNQGKG